MNKELIFLGILSITLLLVWSWLVGTGQGGLSQGSGPVRGNAPMAAHSEKPPPLTGGTEIRQAKAKISSLEPLQEDSILEKYRLPSVSPEDSYEEILSDYWGLEWPALKAEIDAAGFGDGLDSPNGRDWSVGTPVIGTVREFFDGLEERTIAKFERTWGSVIYEVPDAIAASYLEQDALIGYLLLSKDYNPEGKPLTPEEESSLASLVEERGSLPRLIGDELMERWKQLIREDVREIVKDRPPIHGRSFIGPIVTIPYGTAPLVQSTKPYPVFNIALAGANVNENETLGGLFSGWLTIWAGNDTTLVYLYSEIEEANMNFESAVSSFIQTL